MMSVIVVTYNPVWDKLKKTLLSVLLQKNIELEIIITDDGSKCNYQDKALDLLLEYGINNYTLLANEQNEGTVSNVIKGIKQSKGRYVRLISPGDYLYNSDTLFKTFNYMKSNNVKVCFGVPIYYNDDKKFEIINHRSVPKCLFLYRGKRNESMIRKNYLVLDDMPLGATFCTERNLFLKYLNRFKGRLKLGEDYAYSLMVYDHIKIYFFEQPVIWYEYGHGVSTSNDSVFSRIMKKDWYYFHKTIEESFTRNLFDKKFKLYIKLYHKAPNRFLKLIIRYGMYPDIIFWRIVRKIVNERTITEPDYCFFNKFSATDL